jgi:hypothetical protein
LSSRAATPTPTNCAPPSNARWHPRKQVMIYTPAASELQALKDEIVPADVAGAAAGRRHRGDVARALPTSPANSARNSLPVSASRASRR